MTINLVVWDIDRVWYPDISTTYAAKGSRQTVKQYLSEAYGQGWVTPEQVGLWQRTAHRELGQPGNEYVGAMADMYTDLFYGVNGIPKGTITKEQIIKGKQALLRGLTIGDVKRIADSVTNNPGLVETIENLRQCNIHQIGFSDGLGPFVAYKMIETGGIEIGGIVPAEVRMITGEAWFDAWNAGKILNADHAILEGKTGPFKKMDVIFQRIVGYTLNEVAAIDDSAANLETLKTIRNGGGIGIGYKVNDMKAFQEAGVPVIKGDNLLAFGEVVQNKARMNELCDTWGVRYE